MCVFFFFFTLHPTTLRNIELVYYAQPSGDASNANAFVNLDLYIAEAIRYVDLNLEKK